MLAKLIVYAPTRAAAIERMKRALLEFVLLGVGNNIEFLRRVVSNDDFAAGKIDTSFLDDHRDVFSVTNDVPVEALLVATLASAYGRSRSLHDSLQKVSQQSTADVWSSGAWRNS
jgi:acetyl/propionyl-CoA carboxylase alpha subunit